MAYGKGRVVNPKSVYYDEIVTIDEYVRWRDGSVSVWFTPDDGLEGSMPSTDIELTEVFGHDSNH